MTTAEVWGAPPLPPSRPRLRAVQTVRLSRHVVRLADGHQVQALVAGRGMPLVVVHGFAAEGLLYSQSLSRLASMGFKVVAIDTAGHGGTAVLPRDGHQLASYSQLLGRAVEELGIRRAVFAGHSMGGRLVAELAAQEPARAVALLLIDAIVGDTWDRIVAACRWWPPLLSVFGTAALIDGMTNISLDDTHQTAKMARLWARTTWGDLSRPWQLLNPFLSVLRSSHSAPLLDALASHGTPTTLVHGDRDIVVPVVSARQAARRCGGDLVVVEGASHSWMLKDPDTFPAIIGTLLRGRLGEAYEQALTDAGVDPSRATTADIEGALYEPDAPVLRLSPELRFARSDRRHTPRYRFTVERYETTSP
ncbi:MAG: alpha/beta fold hydrolase [Acidimicrobiia bacterium]